MSKGDISSINNVAFYKRSLIFQYGVTGPHDYFHRVEVAYIFSNASKFGRVESDNYLNLTFSKLIIGIS